MSLTMEVAKRESSSVPALILTVHVALALGAREASG
jgi:hypothetical protein